VLYSKATFEHQTRLKMFGGCKHSSLLCFGVKRIYHIGLDKLAQSSNEHGRAFTKVLTIIMSVQYYLLSQSSF